MDLSVFQAFQLCVFGHELSAIESKQKLAKQYIWDGQQLKYSTLSVQHSLPITSSGVDYETVYAYRKKKFNEMIHTDQALMNNYVEYHQHQSGKCSVKMCREDAQTVSFTKISINQHQALGQKVKIEYLDYLNKAPDNVSSLIL